MRSTRFTGFLIVIAAVSGVLSINEPAMGQSPSRPDLNGLWMSPSEAVLSPNFEQALGKELPYTEYGRQRRDAYDFALDPGARCLPLGPTRTWQVNLPFQIIQAPNTVAVLYESQRTFRLIYTDGRGHPEIVYNYPEWTGHSVGRYEGDTLVVETVGINPRANLDNAGHEHSDKLRLEDRIRRKDAKTLEWQITFHDPVFFTEPFTLSKTFNLLENDRVMDYTCAENNKDVPHLVPGAVVGRP
jgi:hypothetical protein